MKPEPSDCAAAPLRRRARGAGRAGPGPVAVEEVAEEFLERASRAGTAACPGRVRPVAARWHGLAWWRCSPPPAAACPPDRRSCRSARARVAGDAASSRRLAGGAQRQAAARQDAAGSSGLGSGGAPARPRPGAIRATRASWRRPSHASSMGAPQAAPVRADSHEHAQARPRGHMARGSRRGGSGRPTLGASAATLLPCRRRRSSGAGGTWK